MAVIFKCKLSYQEILKFHALLQHKNTQHGFPNKKANFDPDNIIYEVDDAKLKEDLHSCQHFLVYSELDLVRHKVFNYALENLKAKLLDKRLQQ